MIALDDQRDALRANAALVAGAFREVLRFESRIRVFGRTATNEWTVDGIAVPAGSRLAVLFGCANRDERKWKHADRFDIQRNNIDHLAFAGAVAMVQGGEHADRRMQ